MSDLITDEMVETAAATLYGERWDDVDESTRIDYRTVAAEMLTAAAPIIAAKALQDAARKLRLGVGLPALRITGEHAEEIARLALLARADRIARGES